MFLFKIQFLNILLRHAIAFFSLVIIVAYGCEIYKHLPYATFNLVAL